jgi:hypothetical protein
MDNFLFKNFKKQHFIYLLITIIIILLLFKISVEGFIPYYIKTDDINSYCKTNSSGQYYAPTMISNFKCGNQSQPNTIPISHTINFTNLQLKNNLCPLNATYISPGTFGAVGSPYCIINTAIITQPINEGLKCWYGYDFGTSSILSKIIFNLDGTLSSYSLKPKLYNKLISYTNLLARAKIQDPTDMYHNLLSTVTESTFNKDYLPISIDNQNLPIRELSAFGGLQSQMLRLFNYGSYSFVNVPSPVDPLFTNNAMTIFIVYNVISTTSPIDNKTIINTSVLTANNKPFDIYKNIRSINNKSVTSSIMIGSDDLTLTLYTASVNTSAGTVYWNEKIYNENGVKSANLTISGVTAWDTSGNILNIGGNSAGTTGFYGNIGDILVYNTILDSNSYINNVLYLLQKFKINPPNMNIYN